MKIEEISEGEYIIHTDVEFDSTEDWSPLDALIVSDSIKSLVFDLSLTTYINSSAFGYTVSVGQTLLERGASFKLTNLCEKVSLVFKCLGGYELLTIES